MRLLMKKRSCRSRYDKGLVPLHNPHFQRYTSQRRIQLKCLEPQPDKVSTGASEWISIRERDLLSLGRKILKILFASDVKKGKKPLDKTGSCGTTRVSGRLAVAASSSRDNYGVFWSKQRSILNMGIGKVLT
ncbi:hypothetical protein Bca4012_038889 [Brassica carinata]